MMDIKDVPELEYYLKIKENVFLLACNIVRTGKIYTSNKPMSSDQKENSSDFCRENENNNNNEFYTIKYPKNPKGSIENDCNLL